MSAIPKPTRVQSKEYLRFVRTQRCIVPKCYKYTQAHHVRFDGQGALGTKVSDFQSVPCCDKHHREFHDIGRERFAVKYALDFQEIVQRLMGLYVAEGVG